MTLLIAICAGDALVCRQLESGIQAAIARRKHMASVVAFPSPVSLLAEAARCRFNAYFLDADAMGPGAADVCRRLRERGGGNLEPIVLFTDAPESVFELLRADPFRILRKGRLAFEIDGAVGDLCDRLTGSGADVMLFEHNGKIFALPTAQIQYVECVNKVQIIHAQGGQHSIKSKINELESRLGPRGFLRVHKSYLVNYRHIFSIELPDVVLTNGVHIPLSKHRAPDVASQYRCLLKGT